MTIIQEVLASIGPEEVVCTSTIRARFPQWKKNTCSNRLIDLWRKGWLVRCGQILDERTNCPMWLYCRPTALAASEGADGPSEDVEIEEPYQWAPENLPPFVALYTPPLPAFRILRTRVLRPLASNVEGVRA